MLNDRVVIEIERAIKYLRHLFIYLTTIIKMFKASRYKSLEKVIPTKPSFFSEKTKEFRDYIHSSIFLDTFYPTLYLTIYCTALCLFDTFILEISPILSALPLGALSCTVIGTYMTYRSNTGIYRIKLIYSIFKTIKGTKIVGKYDHYMQINGSNDISLCSTSKQTSKIFIFFEIKNR